MLDLVARAPSTRRRAPAGHGLPHKSPGEDTGEGEDGLELPVNPDEGIPLVPDEEGGVTVPG